MREVQTANGPVPAEALGVTLAHEHIVLASPMVQRHYPWAYDREVAIAHAVAELREASDAGVGTIVDVTTPDLGRDAALVREIARRAGVHVVICTGIWIDRPRWVTEAPVEAIADAFVREIEQGVEGTEIRAGVIKVANNDPELDEPSVKVLRAAALAAARTGVPITTHTRGAEVGRAQMRVFANEDVDPALIAIGHSFTDDVGYLREIVGAGHFVSIDHFGASRTEREPGVLKAIAALAADGHAARLMLSHDHSVEGWYRAPGHGAHASPSGFTYVPLHARAAMLAAGVGAADVEAMLLTAPAHFLAGVAAS
jgi:phosphotriesterase-related protein